MGMAASQARFLNLTARKTNIEYQGQQINEQRTSLSNESADLYNQMLTLQVPTPPNTQDFTKVQYTFMMPGGVDEANVSQITQYYTTSGNPPTTTAVPGQYNVIFSYKTVELGMPACADNEKSRAVKSGTDYLITTVEGKTYTAATATGDVHTDAVTTLQNGDATEIIYYINVGTEEAPKYQYYKNSELTTATGASSTAVTYYSAQDVEVYKEDKYSPCTINRDVYNRVQSFTHNGTSYAVTTKTITDEDSYNDAMNEYTYQSYLYEQTMAEINAKTSIIQAQDRTLELKLKQLDTEHNAVQTEIEAVKGVCKKNVEDSFKTFA